MIKLPKTLCECPTEEDTFTLKTLVPLCSFDSCSVVSEQTIIKELEVLCACPEITVFHSPVKQPVVKTDVKTVICFDNYIKNIVTKKYCDKGPTCR